MRILEIAASAEHLTPDELAEALEEGEAACRDETVALDRLQQRRAELVDGPSSTVSALDVEIRTRRHRVSLMQNAILEVHKRHQAVTRWQPRPRPGGSA